MPIRPNREYRNIESASSVFEAREDSFIVTGYATTFNQPYKMYTDENGNDYYEVIDRNAFINADMSDVIFQTEHSGPVYARTRNKSLQLEVDEHGLKVIADLSGTEAGKDIYRSVRSGLLDRMSYGFVVDEDIYDATTRTRTILSIKKVFDVSSVAFPANPETEIAVRNLVSGWRETELKEIEKQQNIAKQRQRIKILTELN